MLTNSIARPQIHPAIIGFVFLGVLVALLAGTPTVSAQSQNSPATGAPIISGTVQVGETLTADTSEVADSDGLSNVSYNYQWLADNADIAGATNSTYTLVAADEGKTIKVKVTFTDDAGNDESLTSEGTLWGTFTVDSTPPVWTSSATGEPTISGTAQVGETLTADTSGIADTDGLTNVSYNYQWLADDADIDGATSSTYTVQSTDNGKVIKVRVTFTDDANNDESLTSDGTAAVNSATGAPTISGTAQVGQTLTADTSGISDPDGLTNVIYSYQWLADDADIDGATSYTYTLVAADENKVIKVRVTFTDDAGNEESLTSAGTAAVVLGGL